MADSETAPKVAIIGESVARRFFPHEDPVGKRLGFGKSGASGEFQVVGVVKDVQPHLGEREPLRAVYIPYTQAPADTLGQMTFVVRTHLDPNVVIATVRRQIQSIAKNLPLVDLKTQAEDAVEELGNERSLATLLSFFGALALLLAAIGLYGTVSYTVASRTKELGIRMALGARQEDMLRMVLGETFSLLLVGLAIGVPLSLAATWWIASLVFGVKLADAVTIAAACAVMVAVGLAAGYMPARRATSVNPVVALRYE